MFSNPEVPLASLPRAADLEWHALHPRFVTRILSQRILVLGVAALTLGVATIVVFAKQVWEGYATPMASVVWGLGVCFAAWRLIWPVFEVPRRGYAVREKDIAFKSGLLWRSVTVVPFNRVQHAATGSGMLDRNFGLATLTVFTAGGSGGDLHIAGLGAERAERLRAHVVAKVGGGANTPESPDHALPPVADEGADALGGN